MNKLTEYHNGVAVIKGKRFDLAAEKLALLEDFARLNGWKIDAERRTIGLPTGNGYREIMIAKDEEVSFDE